MENDRKELHKSSELSFINYERQIQGNSRHRKLQGLKENIVLDIFYFSIQVMLIYICKIKASNKSIFYKSCFDNVGNFMLISWWWNFHFFQWYQPRMQTNKQVCLFSSVIFIHCTYFRKLNCLYKCPWLSIFFWDASIIDGAVVEEQNLNHLQNQQLLKWLS